MISPITLPGARRLVSLGSLAVRPVAYAGEGAAGFFDTPTTPIDALAVRSIAEPRRTAIFHERTNWYGLTDLAPGPHRVHVVDPQRRFLPRALAAVVPDRRPLAAAIERGAAVLPAVPVPAFVTARMRPAPGGAPALGTALWGVVRDAAGAPQPFAWVRVATAQGDYVTYADERGEYVVPLAFLRAAAPADDDAAPPPVAAEVAARPMIAAGDPLAAFPVDFDEIAPGDASFDAVYGDAVFDKPVDVYVGTNARLDLEPA